jgi:Helix-turn-helix
MDATVLGRVKRWFLAVLAAATGRTPPLPRAARCASTGPTQEQLAERMHTTQAVIACLESGRVKPSTRTLERLVEATGGRLKISFEPAPTR